MVWILDKGPYRECNAARATKRATGHRRFDFDEAGFRLKAIDAS